MSWSVRCPTFLIGKGGFHELNWVAASLLDEQERGERGEPQPIHPTMNEETRQKGKITLRERVEKVVVNGAGKFQRLVTGEVKELSQPNTGKSAKSTESYRHRHHQSPVRRDPTGMPTRSSKVHRHRSQSSVRRAQTGTTARSPRTRRHIIRIGRVIGQGDAIAHLFWEVW